LRFRRAQKILAANNIAVSVQLRLWGCKMKEVSVPLFVRV
jgi:hypothetical protein